MSKRNVKRISHIDIVTLRNGAAAEAVGDALRTSHAWQYVIALCDMYTGPKFAGWTEWNLTKQSPEYNTPAHTKYAAEREAYHAAIIAAAKAAKGVDFDPKSVNPSAEWKTKVARRAAAYLITGQAADAKRGPKPKSVKPVESDTSNQAPAPEQTPAPGSAVDVNSKARGMLSTLVEYMIKHAETLDDDSRNALANLKDVLNDWTSN